MYAMAAPTSVRATMVNEGGGEAQEWIRKEWKVSRHGAEERVQHDKQ
jgi:hypothetical protein